MAGKKVLFCSDLVSEKCPKWHKISRDAKIKQKQEKMFWGNKKTWPPKKPWKSLRIVWNWCEICFSIWGVGFPSPPPSTTTMRHHGWHISSQLVKYIYRSIFWIFKVDAHQNRGNSFWPRFESGVFVASLWLWFWQTRGCQWRGNHGKNASPIRQVCSSSQVTW